MEFVKVFSSLGVYFGLIPETMVDMNNLKGSLPRQGNEIEADPYSKELEGVDVSALYLMQHMEEGCMANCAFCVQARDSQHLRKGSHLVDKEMTRLPLNGLTKFLHDNPKASHIKRICIQTIFNKNTVDNLLALITAIREVSQIPITACCIPVTKDKIKQLKLSGLDNITINYETATPELFRQIRGADRNGPYRWNIVSEAIDNALDIFGKYNVGTHLQIGLGETQEEALQFIENQNAKKVYVSLFAFTPVENTAMADMKRVSHGYFHQVQLGAYLISNGMSDLQKMKFDKNGKITDYGLAREELIKIIRTGEPFRNAGCPGCNRVYYETNPGDRLYTYPRALRHDEIEVIAKEILESGLEREYTAHNHFRSTSIIDALFNVAHNRVCFTHFRMNHSVEITISYKEIWEKSLSVAGYLQAKGVKHGDRVLIMMSTCPEFHYSFYGVLMAGAIPIPVAPPGLGQRDLSYYLKHIMSILNDSGSKCIVSLEEDASIFVDSPFGSDCTMIVLSDIALKQSNPGDYYRPQPEDLCFIQYTSGSTDTPKGVALTHHNVISNIEGIGKVISVRDDESGLSWMPLYHDMGLIGGMLLPMYFAFPKMVFMVPMLITKPLLWLKFITEYQSTIVPANNFAFSTCLKKISDEDVETLDLRSWRVAFNGSEPINVNVLEEFYDKFKNCGFSKAAMLPCYGLAEATLGVTFPELGQHPYVLECINGSLSFGSKVELYRTEADSDKTMVRLVSLGKPMDCLEIKIVDFYGNELSADHVGRIVVRGDSVMKGYYNNGDLIVEGVIENGWLLTGDIGFIHDGNLYCSGREKEMVIIHGKNYSAEEIENIVYGACGTNITCVAVGYHDFKQRAEALGIVIETEENDSEQLNTINKMIQKALLNSFQITADSIVTVPANSLPKTFNGKVMRLECSRFFLPQPHQADNPKSINEVAQCG